MMTQWSFTYGTLIQSIFTYEEWIGYDIIFFKIPAGLLKLANKKNQQKTQQDFKFQFFFKSFFTLFSYKP